MNIYREFPLDNVPKRLFCNKNGRTNQVQQHQKQFELVYFDMLKNSLNKSMQYKNNVKSVSRSESGRFVVNCKDGNKCYY